ncbi:hypothetical protein SPBR_06262 [Sporothrix brasiliensis 5110]|uniref:Uncharacterized protein n=1 Tax=Sporothrix brasiliensis 5110 TaxID=1398154 RepID=A0A0C2JC39_9PEZI|nr:uncharacterized protein SPBR_06262 [Sporothrix brasiliensis 5110]KIH94477.1 hypothetical protein SPBR_06262 [Sporothrix brasiliensis 5110]
MAIEGAQGPLLGGKYGNLDMSARDIAKDLRASPDRFDSESLVSYELARCSSTGCGDDLLLASTAKQCAETS